MPETPGPSNADDHERALSRLNLAGIVVPKAADVLADQLRQQILDGSLPIGLRLPVERSLAETTGMSRGTVRDALRVLELEGLIETRPGRVGGSVVKRPEAGSLGRTIEIFIRGRQVHIQSLLEMRELLEPEAARLAAARRTDDDLDMLRERTEKLEGADASTYLDRNVDWHLGVAQASHNELLIAVMTGMSSAIFQSTDTEKMRSPAIRERTETVHRKIVEAIDGENADEAHHLMLSHMHGFRTIAETDADAS